MRIAIISTIAIITMFMMMDAKATTMCALEDTTAIILDPSVNATSRTSPENGTWTATFPYGTIYGINACLSVSTGPVSASGGENEGNLCWCKIVHPVSSSWIIHGNVASGCLNYCGYYCSNSMSNKINFRRALYDSITQ